MRVAVHHAPLSRRKTRPLVVPAKILVAEANTMANKSPEPAGSVTTSAHDVPKLDEMNTCRPSPTATISASAGFAVLIGAPTSGEAMTLLVEKGGVTCVHEPRLKGLST